MHADGWRLIRDARVLDAPDEWPVFPSLHRLSVYKALESGRQLVALGHTLSDAPLGGAADDRPDPGFGFRNVGDNFAPSASGTAPTPN